MKRVLVLILRTVFVKVLFFIRQGNKPNLKPYTFSLNLRNFPFYLMLSFLSLGTILLIETDIDNIH